MGVRNVCRHTIRTMWPKKGKSSRRDWFTGGSTRKKKVYTKIQFKYTWFVRVCEFEFIFSLLLVRSECIFSPILFPYHEVLLYSHMIADERPMHKTYWTRGTPTKRRNKNWKYSATLIHTRADTLRSEFCVPHTKPNFPKPKLTAVRLQSACIPNRRS